MRCEALLGALKGRSDSSFVGGWFFLFVYVSVFVCLCRCLYLCVCVPVLHCKDEEVVVVGSVAGLSPIE